MDEVMGAAGFSRGAQPMMAGVSVLDRLLEGFDEAKHPRGYHGRFSVGDHVTFSHLLGKVPARVTKVTASRVHVTSSDSRVSDTSMTHNQAAAKLEHMIGPHAVRPRLAKGQTANELRGGIPMVTPNPMSSSSRERGLASIEAGRRTDRPRIRPEDQPAFDPVTMLGREGTAARGRGATNKAVMHADIRDKLTNLPQGQRYNLAGPQGGVGHVLRTPGGFEVYTSNSQPDRVHKTPSAASGHAMKLERTAFEGTPQRADVMARNYRHGQEVRAMNERQAKRAEEESKRQEQIAAMHGGYKVGEHVTYETGSRGAGGHGPVTFTQQPGVHEIVGLQRNGNLRLREPKHGTTFDVHHLHVKRARKVQASAPAPELLGVLLEGAHDRVEEAIGHIEKGAFHRWLGKKADEPITDADIKRGLAAGGHPAKMAQFAKAARKFGK